MLYYFSEKSTPLIKYVYFINNIHRKKSNGSNFAVTLFVTNCLRLWIVALVDATFLLQYGYPEYIYLLYLGFNDLW